MSGRSVTATREQIAKIDRDKAILQLKRTDDRSIVFAPAVTASRILASHRPALTTMVAERHLRRAVAKEATSPNGLRFKVPQSLGGHRETAEQRKERLQERRRHQLARKPGYTPVATKER